MKTEEIFVQGRRIRVYAIWDGGTQTVNICTPANRFGDYEHVFPFKRRYRVDGNWIRCHASLGTLVRELRKRLLRQVAAM